MLASQSSHIAFLHIAEDFLNASDWWSADGYDATMFLFAFCRLGGFIFESDRVNCNLLGSIHQWVPLYKVTLRTFAAHSQCVHGGRWNMYDLICNLAATTSAIFGPDLASKSIGGLAVCFGTRSWKFIIQS